MLLAAEELLLFLLDEQNATLLPMTVRTEHLVLAGAVLMDLQLANRIDTDLDNLTVSNPTPLGDDVLDLVDKPPRTSPNQSAGRAGQRSMLGGHCRFEPTTPPYRRSARATRRGPPAPGLAAARKGDRPRSRPPAGREPPAPACSSRSRTHNRDGLGGGRCVCPATRRASGAEVFQTDPTRRPGPGAGQRLDGGVTAACFRARLAAERNPAAERTARVGGGYRRTAGGGRGRGRHGHWMGRISPSWRAIAYYSSTAP